MKNKGRRFLLFNVAQWCFFGIVFFIVALFQKDTFSIINVLFVVVVGSLLSFVLRVIYKKVKIIKKGIWLYIPFILVCSIGLGFLWNLLYVLLFSNSLITDITIFTVYFFIWSCFYFGIKFYYKNELLKKDIEHLKKNYDNSFVKNNLAVSLISKSLYSVQELVKHDMLLALNKMDSFISIYQSYYDDDSEYCKIKDEVDLMNKYLSIEKRRLGKNLDFVINFDLQIANEKISKFFIYALLVNVLECEYNVFPVDIDICIDMFDSKIKVESILRGEFYKVIKNKRRFVKFLNIENIQTRLNYIYKTDYSIKIEESIDCIQMKIIVKRIN